MRNDRGDIQEGDFLTYGVFQRVAGAAADTVVNGDEQGAVVHHIAVAADHAEAVVAVLDQGLKIALLQNGLVAGPLRLRPARPRASKYPSS